MYCVISVTFKCHIRNELIMNTKKILKNQGLIPKTSQSNEMNIFGLLSLLIVLSAVVYFS